MVRFHKFYWPKILIIAFVSLTLLSPLAYASQLSSKRQELKKINSKILQNKQAIANVEKKKEAVLQEIARNDKKISELQNEISNLKVELLKATARRRVIEVKLFQLKQELKKTESELAAAEKNLALKQQIFNRRINNIYKNGKTNILEIILSTRSLSDLIERAAFIGMIVKNDVKLVRQMKELKAAIAKKAEQVRAKKKDVNKQYLILVDEENHLKAVNTRLVVRQKLYINEMNRQKTIFANLKALKAKLAYDLDVLESSSNLIARQIRELERRGSASVSRNYARSGNGFIRPVDGPITSGYGWRYHP
ncbi:MAG: hypothetical protein QME63_02945, partial [Actinomycetota bacterium]|nr:hypothetical protein [Actinomycetota bacterium]